MHTSESSQSCCEKAPTPNKDHSGVFQITVGQLETAVTRSKAKQPQLSRFQELIRPVRRPLFVGLAMLVGVGFAMCVTPTIAYRDSAAREGWYAPQSSVPYLFSFYTGSYIASTLVFALYCLIRRNRPYVARALCLPGLVSGLLCSMAVLSWFMSLDRLGQGFTGPITAMMPGCVGCLWSVLYYKEVKAGRSYYYMVAAIVMTLAGALSIGVSK